MRVSFKISLALLGISALALLLLGYQADQMARRALIDRTFHQLNSVNLLKHSHLYARLNADRDRLADLVSIPQVEEDFQALMRGDTASLSEVRTRMDRWAMTNWALLGPDTLYKVSGGDGAKWWAEAATKFDGRAVSAHWLVEAQGPDSSEALGLVLVQPVGDGRLLVRLPTQPVWGILGSISGMGTSGESYLVADDQRMRSPSRFLIERQPREIVVETDASLRAVSGEVGQQEVIDYRGVPVLSVYRPVRIGGLSWAILSEIDRAEALRPASKQAWQLVAIGLGCMVLIFFASLVVSQSLSSPIHLLEGIVRQLSRGALPRQLPRPRGRDEIADMQRALIELIDALRRRAKFASSIGKGEFQLPFEPLGDEDELGQSLLTMRDRLLASQQAEQHREQERRSAWVEGEERERTRIARDLHDGLGQILLAMRLRLANLPLDGKELGPLVQMLDEAVEESRRITRNLTPSILSDFGLGPALRELAQKTDVASDAQVLFQWQQAEKAPPLGPVLQVTGYRVVQEALSNALRHAEAKRIEIRGDLTATQLILSVTDDGQGFEPANARSEGLGLRNLRERVNLAGGQLDLTTQPGKGTQITATFSLNEA